MTAQKTHFDFHAEGLEAFCGTQPRGRDLDLSERRKDVTCAKCLKMLADYDEEVDNAELHFMLATREAEYAPITEGLIERLAIATASYPEERELTQVGELVTEAPLNLENQKMFIDIADRNGLHPIAVEIGFQAGWLKR